MGMNKLKSGFRQRFSSKKSSRWFQNRLVAIGGGDSPYTQQIEPGTQVVDRISISRLSCNCSNMKNGVNINIHGISADFIKM